MWNKLLTESASFLDKVFLFVEGLDIDVSDLFLDHIALRFKKVSDVDGLFSQLSKEGKILSEKVVNGRKIGVIKLSEPICYKSRRIPCVELPYPGENHDYPSDGWEHAEFVLPVEMDEELEDAFRRKFPAVIGGYRLAVPKVESEQLPNPTLVFEKYRGLAVKFHPNSIEEVVLS